jgi:hypothetical protein
VEAQTESDTDRPFYFGQYVTGSLMQTRMLDLAPQLLQVRGSAS